MLAMAFLLYLPPVGQVIGALSIIFGHNILDSLHFTQGTLSNAVWAILHEKQVLNTGFGFSVRTTYPVLPPIGLMLLGYSIGPIFTSSVAHRHKMFIFWGSSSLFLYFILRFANIYGDPHDFVVYDSIIQTIMSFFNPTKYPMSCQFILLTIGLALIFLVIFESSKKTILAKIGSTPMYYYIIHLYIIHASALILALTAGYTLDSFDFVKRLGGLPVGFTIPLWGCYLIVAMTALNYL